MSVRDEALQRWWPTTQALDLVDAPVDVAAAALAAEVTRFLKGEDVATSWEAFPDLDAAFGLASEFANVPTVYLVLPTVSQWSVLWNNSFLCDGYDSLCWCLTSNHGLTTVHWSAHDEWTTFQSGAGFIHRRKVDGAVVERSVQAAQEDRRWLFHESGPTLAEEDIEAYTRRRKRDRLDERGIAQLLGRLGAFPWSERFYATGERQCFLLRRSHAPPTIIRRTTSEVVRGG